MIIFILYDWDKDKMQTLNIVQTMIWAIEKCQQMIKLRQHKMSTRCQHNINR